MTPVVTQEDTMRADRLLSMVMVLQTRGKMTASALALELGVSRRTILRDVEALSLAGVPIYADGGHGGGIALDENYRTTLTGLKESEVRALFISGNSQLLNQIGLGDAAESTLLKLAAALPERHQPSVEHIRQRIYIDPLWWWHDSDSQPYLAELQQAVFEDRCIRAVYEHYNGNIVERVLEPYSLVAKSSFWYLVAKRGDELRTYRASRFHRVELLDQHFQRDPDFDLMTYWHEQLGEFTAAFSEYACTLRVHPDRVMFARWLTPGRNTVLDTGDWVTMHFRVESIELAKMLVFGLGLQGEIVEPESLREAVQESCHTLLDHLARARSH